MNRGEFIKRAILSLGLTAIPSFKGLLAEDKIPKYYRYHIYESMERFPKISSALNSLSCEIAKDFNYHSSDPQIEKYLCDLFEGKLDIKNNLTAWTRNTAKFGNTFLYVLAKKEEGVLFSKQLENFDCLIEGNSLVIGQDTRFSGNEYVNFRGLFDASVLPYNCSLLDGYREQFEANPNSVEPYFNERTKLRFKHNMVMGLNKLAIIHLFHLECKGEELQNFEISM